MENKFFKIIGGIILVLLIIYAIFTGFKSKNEKIKIGVVIPLSGQTASITEDFQKTLNMYAEKSKNIEFVFQDDQCSGKGALSAYNILKNQGIKIYMAACSGSILALDPVLKEDGNLLVTGFGGSIAIRETGDEIIRFIPDGLSIAEGMIKVIKENPNKKYVLFYEQQDYSKSVADKLIQELGDQIVFSESYVADNTSFKTQILKIKEQKTDSIIFIPVSDKAAQVIYKEMVDLNVGKNIFGDVNVCDHAVPPKEFGLHGVCFKTKLDTEGYNNYLSDYKAKYGKDPLYPFYNAISYDIVLTLDDLLAEVNKVTDETISELKTKILDGVEGDVTNYQFTQDGEVTSLGDYLEKVEF